MKSIFLLTLILTSSFARIQVRQLCNVESEHDLYQGCGIIPTLPTTSTAAETTGTTESTSAAESTTSAGSTSAGYLRDDSTTSAGGTISTTSGTTSTAEETTGTTAQIETTTANLGRLLMRRSLMVAGTPFVVHTRRIIYPEIGDGKETITCIAVTDLVDDHHGGCPNIHIGGVDFNYVVLEFVSQRGRDMNFSIEIWGK